MKINPIGKNEPVFKKKRNIMVEQIPRLNKDLAYFTLKYKG